MLAATAAWAGSWAGEPGSGFSMPSSLVLICPAWQASAATSASGAPAAASATAATRPSTIGRIGEHDAAVAAYRRAARAPALR